MAISHTATDSFKKGKLSQSENAESDDIGEFVAGRLPFLCSAEQRLGDDRDQDNDEVNVW
jgi:hypothetical protein